MKKILIDIIKIVCFLIFFLFLFQRISWVVCVYGTDKDNPDRRASLFFSLPKNTVDVMFVGSSHVYCSYIPQQIYDDTGITSACLATSSQSYANTYWLLKEALNYQKPQVVVLDIHSVTTSVFEEVQKSRLHFTSGISVMPDVSINKLFAYQDIKNIGYGWAENMTIYDAYSLLEYKNEYDRKSPDVLELCDIFVNPADAYETFGYMATSTVYPMESLMANITTDNCMEFEDTIEYEYLNKIYHLLKDEDIQLVITRAPHYLEIDDYHLYEQSFEWMKENDIPFIDYFELIDETGIDLKMDFRDADHLNYLGSKKATKYMSDYLKSNYNLEDHRGNSRYYLWEKNDFDYESVEVQILEKLNMK